MPRDLPPRAELPILVVRNLSLGKPFPPTAETQMFLKQSGTCQFCDMPWTTERAGGTEEGNVVPMFKESRKEDPGNYQPANLSSVPRRILEQILLEALLCPTRDREVM